MQEQFQERVVHFYETLAPASLDRLGAIYAADAYFKDPFNEVNGLPAIEAIFRHMFATVDEPQFSVTHHTGDHQHAFLTWRFSCKTGRRKTKLLTIYGATHINFDNHGLVRYHRDYWDVAEEFYEKLPVVGGLLRMLKRLAKAEVSDKRRL